MIRYIEFYMTTQVRVNKMWGRE